MPPGVVIVNTGQPRSWLLIIVEEDGAIVGWLIADYEHLQALRDALNAGDNREAA